MTDDPDTMPLSLEEHEMQEARIDVLCEIVTRVLTGETSTVMAGVLQEMVYALALNALEPGKAGALQVVDVFADHVREMIEMDATFAQPPTSDAVN